MINFYHRFLPNIASILSPLYGALKSSKPQQEISWSHQMKQAFVAAKCALVNATMLAHPCSDCPLALTSDASDRAVGAVLELQTRTMATPRFLQSPIEECGVEVQCFRP